MVQSRHMALKIANQAAFASSFACTSGHPSSLFLAQLLHTCTNLWLSPYIVGKFIFHHFNPTVVTFRQPWDDWSARNVAWNFATYYITLVVWDPLLTELYSCVMYCISTVTHVYTQVRKTFITLAFCDVCKKLLFQGFRWSVFLVH